MDQVAADHPLLIVVAGRPGSGKTTLAHALARAIRCPAICRDEIMEGLVRTTGAKRRPGDGLAMHVHDLFFATIRLLLDGQVTVVAEAAFQHRLWAPQLEQLRAIARIRIVLCRIDTGLARTRVIERGRADPDRERYHGDPIVQAAREGRDLPIGDHQPPDVAVPTLAVDTSHGYSPGLEDVLAFATKP